MKQIIGTDKMNDNEKLKTIVLDTETTGLYPGYDEILQLSIIDKNGNTLFNEYIRPKNNREWAEAQAVNGISPENVAECPTFDYYRNTIQAIFDSADEIIGYNTGFDLAFLKYSGIQINPEAVIIDVMEEFAEIYGEWSPSRCSYKYQKLTTAANYYNLDSDGAHDSLIDARMTLAVYDRINATQTYDSMDVLIVEPRKKPYVHSIENSIRSKEKIVGKDYRCVSIDDDTALWCNLYEITDIYFWDKRKEKKPNRVFRDYVISGTFFIAGAIYKSISCSLTQEQIDEYTDMFADTQEPDVDAIVLSKSSKSQKKVRKRK
jgi:DNA polymerase III epsilon subunit-like protein